MRRSMKILFRRLVGLAVLVGAFAETPGWVQSAADPASAASDAVHTSPSMPAARG